VGQFLAGDLSESDFLAAAKKADPANAAGQWCEACYYAGSKHLVAGDSAGAADFYQKAVATGKTNLQEYHSAAAELGFLNPAKN
jgi:lipoprotein NlpI